MNEQTSPEEIVASKADLVEIIKSQASHIKRLEDALRIRIWNACKAANMKDDAAYQVVEREMAKLLQERHPDAQ